MNCRIASNEVLSLISDIQDRLNDLKKWDFHQPVVRTKHLTREQLGELAVWANMEFYTKKNRVRRVLESPVLHPFSKAIFQSYMAGMEEYARKATGKQVA